MCVCVCVCLCECMFGEKVIIVRNTVNEVVKMLEKTTIPFELLPERKARIHHSLSAIAIVMQTEHFCLIRQSLYKENPKFKLSVSRRICSPLNLFSLLSLNPKCVVRPTQTFNTINEITSVRSLTVQH